MRTDLPYNRRVCTVCTDNIVEDLYHMVMSCTLYEDIRTAMMAEIYRGVSDENKCLLDTMSSKLLFHVLLGMNYPLTDYEIWQVRYYSCQGVYKMYKRRLAVDI